MKVCDSFGKSYLKRKTCESSTQIFFIPYDSRMYQCIKLYVNLCNSIPYYQSIHFVNYWHLKKIMKRYKSFSSNN
jgi:hypothetical protein